MGKKTKHVSEPAYWVPGPQDRAGAAPKKVSKKKALQKARSAKLDPKQRARAKQNSKGGGKRKSGGGKKKK